MRKLFIVLLLAILPSCERAETDVLGAYWIEPGEVAGHMILSRAQIFTIYFQSASGVIVERGWFRINLNELVLTSGDGEWVKIGMIRGDHINLPWDGIHLSLYRTH